MQALLTNGLWDGSEAAKRRMAERMAEVGQSDVRRRRCCFMFCCIMLTPSPGGAQAAAPQDVPYISFLTYVFLFLQAGLKLPRLKMAVSATDARPGRKVNLGQSRTISDNIGQSWSRSLQ